MISTYSHSYLNTRNFIKTVWRVYNSPSPVSQAPTQKLLTEEHSVNCYVLNPFFCFFLPLLSSFVFVLLISTAELTGQLSRPLKVSLTLTKLEQTKAYLKKVLSIQKWDTTAKSASAASSSHSSPTKTPQAFIPRSDPLHQGSSLALTSSIKTLARSFHRVSVHTTQMVVTMETEGHALKPSLTVSLSALTGCLQVKTAPRTEGW